MPQPHLIRLRGPWEYEPVARVVIAADGARQESTADLPPAGRVQLPADWGPTLGHDFRGRVRYLRRFGLPTNLEPGEQVWLVVEGVDYFGAATLNGTRLGELLGYVAPVEFEIGPLLAARNLLALDVELPAYAAGVSGPPRPGRQSLPGGPIGEVRLEIR